MKNKNIPGTGYKGQLLIFIAILKATTLSAQNWTIKVRKTYSDTLNIAGNWQAQYEKTNHTITKIPATETDTFTFYSNGEYQIQHKCRTTGSWEIDKSGQKLHLKSQILTCYIDSQVFTDTFSDSWEWIEFIKSDTIAFRRFLEDGINSEYKVRYYIRRK
ncbi:MAG: glycoside hydrolase family 43 C-terminal domain-containing protein [Bacteroidia bacterium]|jgi:hypothetical protein